MTETPREQAAEILRYFEADLTARLNLGVQDDLATEYLAAARQIADLVTTEQPTTVALHACRFHLIRLLEQQSDPRAEILAEKALPVLRSIASQDGREDRTLRRAVYVARGRRLIAYFDRLVREEGESWRTNLNSAKDLLRLIEHDASAASEFEAMLSRLEHSEHRAGSGLSELVSTCRQAQQLVAEGQDRP